MKVGLVSLGCAKNQVDSELILGVLANASVEIVSDPALADAIIVNTCGFIAAAKEESLETIREMQTYGKKLIVCGCYAQRYAEKLRQDIPGIDRIITLKEYPVIDKILADVFRDPSLKFAPLSYQHRLLTTSLISPYVKLSEGCDNRCTFCAIPLIRGRFKSRSFDEIIEECTTLVQNGAKELNLISQDTTRYGADLTPNKKSLLPELITRISQLPGLVMIRILYLYPNEITDELLEVMRDNPLVAHYFDIPIQHVNSWLLKRMNRRGDEAFLRELIAKIRRMIPDAILRTTIIVGFPGETDEMFLQLRNFIETVPFDRLGVFTYSPEEDTPSFDFPDQVREEVKATRYADIMKVQKHVARSQNKKQIGKTHRVIVEQYDPESKFYYGRSYAFAPDDIDGYIVFQSTRPLEIGDDLTVKITSAMGYDLIGDAEFKEN